MSFLFSYSMWRNAAWKIQLPCFCGEKPQEIVPRVHCKSRLTMIFYSFFYISFHIVPCFSLNVATLLFHSFSFVLCYFLLLFFLIKHGVCQ